MERIEKLRNRALENTVFGEEFFYLFYKEYERLSGLPEKKRYAEAFYAAFSGLTPSISEGELIVGKRDIPMNEAEQREWEEVYRPMAQARQKQAGDGQDSHMAIDYELVLSEGLNGIIARIDTYLQSCGEE